MGNLAIFIGKRIRIIRKNKGFTQEQLGEAVGMPQSYIGGIERGEKNISLETLERLMVALEVTPIEIFRTYNESNQKNKRQDEEKTLEMLTCMLANRTSEEIQMIHRLARDIFNTMGKKSK